MGTMDSLPSQLTEPIIIQTHRAAVEAYLGETRLRPLLLVGDAHVILEQFPESSIDVVTRISMRCRGVGTSAPP